MAECRSSGVGNFLEYHSLPNPLKKERGVVSPRYEHTMFCWSPTILLRSFWATTFWATINPGELRVYGGEGVLQLYHRFVADSLAARQHPCLLSSNTCSARNSNKPAKDDHSATNCQQRSFQSCNSKALSTTSQKCVLQWRKTHKTNHTCTTTTTTTTTANTNTNRKKPRVGTHNPKP